MTLEKALSRFESNELSNLEIARSRRAAVVEHENQKQDKLLDELSTFSTKLVQDRLAESKKRIEKEIAEGQAQAMEEHMEKIENEGVDSIPPEEKQEHEENKEQLNQVDAATKEVGRTVLENGGSFDDAQKVVSMSGHKLYAYTQRKAKTAGKNYEAWLEGEMLTNDKLEVVIDGKVCKPNDPDLNLREKQACMKALRKEFLKENDLIGIKKTLLAEKDGFFESATAAHTTLIGKYTKQDAINRSIKIKDDAIDEFRTNKDFNALYTTLLTTVDPKTGKPLNRTEALDETIKIIKGQMDTEEFTQADLDAMGEREIIDPNTGKLIKIKDKWPTRFKKLNEDMIAADTDNLKTSEQKKQNAFDKDEETLFKAMEEMPEDEITSKFLREKRKELMDAHPGFTSDRLDNYIKHIAEGDDYQTQLGQAEDLLKKGLLTTTELQEFDPRIQKKFSKEAQLIDQALSQENGRHVTELEDIVDYAVNQSGIDKNHPSVIPMTDYVLAKYRQALAGAIAADHPNPSEFAKENTKTWFAKWAENPQNLNENGFKVPNLPTKKEIRKWNKDINKELRRQKKVIKDHGKNILRPENINKLISKEKLIKSATDYYENDGSPISFDYPGEIDTLYNVVGKTGLSKFDLMNQVLKSSGLPELGKKPPSIEKLDKNATKEDNVTLSNKTFDTSARVWGKIAKNSDAYNFEIVGPWSDTLVDWSTENQIDFGEAASAMEFLKSNPNLAAQFGVDTTTFETGEGVDMNRLGLAINVIGWKARNKVGQKFEDWGEHWTNVGNNIVETFKLNEIGEYLAPSPENSANPNVRSGARTPETGFKHVEVEGTNPETDLGKQISDRISDEISNLGNETVDLINNWVDSVLDIDEDQERELAAGKYKISGNIEDAPLRK